MIPCGGVTDPALPAPTTPLCRLCRQPLTDTFVDLGASPLANSFLRPEQLFRMEPHYPLRVHVCGACFLVQLQELETAENIFSDYLYFSSYSDSWLAHARSYADAMIRRFGLTASSLMLEAASNDGYLLQYFVRAGIPVLGIEPAANVAKVAIEKGVPTEAVFFNAETAARLVSQRGQADLMANNNVLAHVPDLHAFVEGFRVVLKPEGVVTCEFPHLLRLIEHNQFDTIYHEHFSYLSLLVVERVFAEHGLRVFDIDELATHGGSLRIYGAHATSGHAETQAVERIRRMEAEAGLNRRETYGAFSTGVVDAKCALLDFLTGARKAGKQVVGYGAPAKGNTLLNYCGVGPELLPYTVDRSPHKQGLYLPGSRIPIAGPEKIRETKPDFVLILPWNLREEIAAQMAEVRSWGGQFAVPIPRVDLF